MTRWLDWLEEKRPEFIATIELQQLMNLTSRIFKQKSRCLWMFGHDKALRLYAQYTKELLLSCRAGDEESLQRRMREEAYKMGNLLRRVTGLKYRRDLERLVFLLYKNIGIEMSGDIPGNIYVSQCYFSDFYDPGMCKLISGMDSGIISGLYGGGKLVFTERITEGCVCCKACFKQNKDVEKCINCGRCAIGCRAGAKWDSRALVDESLQNGARLITGCRVTDLEICDGKVKKVNTITNGRKKSYEADFIVLAAGGLGTPVILENSGIQCEKTLFVDPVLCVAAPWKDARQNEQLLMPFISQQEKYILSPYMDYLSFFFHKDWRMPMDNMVSLMIKMADEERVFFTLIVVIELVGIIAVSYLLLWFLHEYTSFFMKYQMFSGCSFFLFLWEAPYHL